VSDTWQQIRSGTEVDTRVNRAHNAPHRGRIWQWAQITTHSHFTDGILRGGLNYQFH
jgi:hypothetical protein